ncbi:MAG: RDD family protein [Spirochaetales bacterium]|nr:RDD family protein [Spirochaetales bacterium]
MRFCAFWLDQLILFGITAAIYWLLSFAHLINRLGEIFNTENTGALLVSFYYVVMFVLRWGYYLLFEMLFEGRTLGKMVCRLRTIHYTGKALDLPSLVLRNFARVLDQELTFFLGAFICMLVNREYRRIGDLLGNTIVVRNPKLAPIETAFHTEAPFDPAALPESATGAVFLRRLSEEELYVLRRFLVGQADIPKARRRELLAAMAETVSRKIQDSLSPDDPLPYLQSVYARHQVRDAVV